jgi:hypothetical protein
MPVLTRSAALLLIVVAGCSRGPVAPRPSSPTTADITAHDLQLRLRAFADDSMMGREAGSIWDAKASAWVASQFHEYGLEPAGQNGGYLQDVPDIRPRDPTTPRAAAQNVVAIVRGSDPIVSHEYVAITAHNDHIGFTHHPLDHDSVRAANIVTRPRGADSPFRPATAAEQLRIRAMTDSLHSLHGARLDSIDNGADDDGSGTVALIELAEAFARGRVKPRRSILFVSHTAEEKGLRGSEWYTDHATVPMDSIVAEIDLDMIGRGAATDIAGGGPTYLEVVGLRRLSVEYGHWLEAINAKQSVPFVFNYEYDAPGHPDEYYCRADHYSYARYGVPSVSLSRGSHVDYHQLTDEAQYIDYADYARLMQFVFDAAMYVANADHRPRLSVPKPSDPHVPCRQ